MNRKDGIERLRPEDFPPLFREIADPPKALYIKGTLPPPTTRLLCVVGSRSYSPYGKDVCERLIAGLTGCPIAVVSGLALGVDGVAHAAALRAGLPTIAVPGSGLDESVLYPRAHLTLSREIVARGGALISELSPEEGATAWSFPKRNRLMAGMCDAVLIIEAREKSGTLITARLGMEYNRDVLVVPSPLFAKTGEGSNRLLREGAQVVTCAEDILESLHLPIARHGVTHMLATMSEEERAIYDALETPLPRDELLAQIGLSATRAHILISAMEIRGFLRERLGRIERS